MAPMTMSSHPVVAIEVYRTRFHPGWKISISLMAPMTMSSHPVVAIAGATGHLGQRVASAFLSSLFHGQFSEVILLSRQDSSLSSIPDSARKYTIRKYDENNLLDALRGVQVLVNTVGPPGHSFKEKLVQALPHTNVQVYFPSEFSVDHYVHDFPHLEWDQKKKHLALAQQLVPNVKSVVFLWSFLRRQHRAVVWFRHQEWKI